MLLKEAAPAALAPVPVREFATHLRLAYGFTDDGSEDPLLEIYLRNAAAVIESRTGQALIERPYTLQVAGWDRHGHATLPIGPVARIDAIRLVRPDGSFPLSPGEWSLEPGRSRQRVTGTAGGALRPLAHGAFAELSFNAGHGPDWEDVPDDLRQAVLLLAGHYYENRYGELSTDSGLPQGVRAILEPHRPVRL